MPVTPGHQQRIASRLCRRCEAPLPQDHETQRCEACEKNLNTQRSQLRSERKAGGLCYRCGEQAIPGRTRCLKCREKDRSRTTKWSRSNVDAGQCARCGKHPILPSLLDAGTNHRMCQVCYFKKVARHRLGSSNLWVAVQNQFAAQCGRCAYTGKRLTLGLDDSLDHISPVHHFPELRSDPANTEWVSREINEMKRDRTPEQFIEAIRNILEYRATGPVGIKVGVG